MSSLYWQSIRRYSYKNAKNFPKTALTLSHAEKLNSNICDLTDSDIDLNNDSLKMHISQYPNAVRYSIPRNDKDFYDAIKRFDEVCYYTGPERELFPSLVLIDTYKAIESPARLTPDNLKLASMLAWCFEMQTTAYILTDDIMDCGEVRWKKPCWHKQSKIGLTAVVDIRLLFMSGFSVLRKYFHGHESYVPLWDLLKKVAHTTCLGQSLDINSAARFKNERDINLISMETYKTIVKLKTDYIMFTAPLLAVLILAKIKDQEVVVRSKKIMENISICCQAQNDMSDIYGKFRTIGRTCTDVSTGKCTWVSATVVECANDKQKKLLQEHYGRNELDSHNIVYGIFNEVDVIGRFDDYRNRVISECTDEMVNFPYPRLANLFNQYIEKYMKIDHDFSY